MTQSTAPAVQRLGDAPALLVQGRALIDLHFLAALGVRETIRRDAIRPSPGLAALLDDLAAAADAERARMSPLGRSDVPGDAEPASSTPTDDLTVQEAADMLAISARQVRRIAADLMGSRGPGCIWTFPRGAIEHAAATRHDRRTAA